MITPCKFSLAPERENHFHQLSKEEKSNIIPAGSELLGEIKVSGATKTDPGFGFQRDGKYN